MSDPKLITVLYVHANNTDIGGADFCLFKLADELDKNKFRPVVCLSENTSIVDLYKKAGIKVHVIDMIRIKKSFNIVYLSKLALKIIPTVRQVQKIIKDEDVDIVHGNDLLDLYGPIAGRFSNKAVLQYVRWILEYPASLRLVLTSIVHKLNHKVLTVSDGVANDMFTRRGKVMPKIYTCYDCIDMSKVGHLDSGGHVRESLDISEDAQVVGVVGRLDPWKGHALFLKAASLVIHKYPKSIFLVVGGNVVGNGRENLRKELEQLTITLRISENVIFLGHRTDISDVMEAMNIVVHSSITPDPLPGVVMEAQYCKRPVVGAKAGGVPEEIEDGVTGLLYEMGNHLDMADKICDLLSDNERAVNMGMRGHARVTRVFNKHRLCKRIENVYSDLVGS